MKEIILLTFITVFGDGSQEVFTKIEPNMTECTQKFMKAQQSEAVTLYRKAGVVGVHVDCRRIKPKSLKFYL